MQTFQCAHVLKPGWGQSSACHCHRIASFTLVSWFLPVVGNSKRTSRLHPVCSAPLSNYSQRHREQSVQHLLQAPCSLSDSLTSSCSTRHLNVFECPWHHLFTLASFGLLNFLILFMCLQPLVSPSGRWTFSWFFWFVIHTSLHSLGHPLLNLLACWFMINKVVSLGNISRSLLVSFFLQSNQPFEKGFILYFTRKGKCTDEPFEPQRQITHYGWINSSFCWKCKFHNKRVYGNIYMFNPLMLSMVQCDQIFTLENSKMILKHHLLAFTWRIMGHISTSFFGLFISKSLTGKMLFPATTLC